MKNKIAYILIIGAVLMLFTGCKAEPKTVYNSESVKIVQEGQKIAVYDLLTNKAYNFGTKLVKRKEGILKAYTTVDTDTMKITIIPRGLRVYDKGQNKVFSIERKLK